jgi:hypothetical protein
LNPGLRPINPHDVDAGSGQAVTELQQSLSRQLPRKVAKADWPLLISAEQKTIRAPTIGRVSIGGNTRQRRPNCNNPSVALSYTRPVCNACGIVSAGPASAFATLLPQA